MEENLKIKNLVYPLDKPKKEVLDILKGYSKSEIECILRGVNSKLEDLLVCH